MKFVLARARFSLWMKNGMMCAKIPLFTIEKFWIKLTVRRASGIIETALNCLIVFDQKDERLKIASVKRIIQKFNNLSL